MGEVRVPRNTAPPKDHLGRDGPARLHAATALMLRSPARSGGVFKHPAPADTLTTTRRPLC